ncbi:HU family DNA-binding protein [Desulfovibrio sp.]
MPRLGKFKSKAVAARKGRNPRTGEILEIPAGKKLVFITCKELKEAMRS